MAQVGVHCLVSGIVQGVFFRKYTKLEADRLELTGWVRNMADGRVELEVFGEEDNLDKLVAWLHNGPARAEVSGVESTSIPWQKLADFRIEH